MRIGNLHCVCLVAGTILTLGQPAKGLAQDTTAAAGKITVAATLGVRAYTTRPDSLQRGMFEEYRDLHANAPGASAVLDQLFMKYTPADHFGIYQLSARKVGDRDQSMWLEAKEPGSYDFQIRWDRIPHIYSTTARYPGDVSIAGFNTLPSPRPDSTAWRNAPYVGTLQNQWDPVKVGLALTPSDKLDFKAEYTHIGKSGGMPGSVSFNGASGPTSEFVNPIDQTINDFKLSQSYASGDRSKAQSLTFIKSFQVQAAYAYSGFENSMTSVMVDNPQLSVSSPTLGAASSLVSLAPNNTAQTAAFTGAVVLPMRTRVMGTFTGSWRSQNDPFFPQTSNDSLAGNANFGLVSPLQRASLDGRVITTAASLSVNTHPTNRLTLSAKYRDFNYGSQTVPLHVNATVINDHTITAADSANSELYPFSKANVDVSAAYRLADALALTVGYAWEGWTRDTAVRNVAKTQERTPRVSLDYDGLDWLSLRASYSAGLRRGSGWTVLDNSQTIGFQEFDLADRNQALTNLMASVTPIDNLTLSFDYQLGNASYPHTLYGTQSDVSTVKSFDLQWRAMDRLTVNVGYSMEDDNLLMQMLYKTGADTVGSPTYNNPSFRWYSRNTDRDRTVFASFDAVIIPNRLEAGGTASLAASHFWVYNGNPTTPTGGTIAQDSAAMAANFPEVSQRMEPVALFLRYHYSADWAVTLRYQVETYGQIDYRTSVPSYLPFAGALPGAIGQIAGSNTGQYHFLGSTYLPYAARWFTLLFTYHPAAMPFAKARSTI